MIMTAELNPNARNHWTPNANMSNNFTIKKSFRSLSHNFHTIWIYGNNRQKSVHKNIANSGKQERIDAHFLPTH